MKQPVQSNEVKVLRHIHQSGKGKPGYSYIIDLYDAFIVRGPNGFHECLVTEVVLPLGTMFLRQKLESRLLIEQLLKGFEFLHSEGVVHGGEAQMRNYALWKSIEI